MSQKKSNNKIGFYSKKIKGYFKSARLESVIVSTSFLLIGLYYATNSLPLEESLLGFLSIALLVTAGSWQNYIYDIAVDKKAGKNIDFFNYISPKEMLFSSFITGISALVVLYYLDFYSFIIGLLEFIIFLVYAAPPIRFKNRRFFDFVANMMVFGTLPFLIGFRIFSMPVEFKYFVLSIIFGLIAGSYYLFISNFEIDADKKVGVKNTCTFLGSSNTINVAIIVFLISMISYILFFNISEKIVLIGFLITTPLVILTRFTKNPQILIVLVSFIFLFWNGVILLLLSVYTLSILSIILFLIIVLILAMALYTWMVTET